MARRKAKSDMEATREPEAMRVAIYLRVSTDEQRRSGLGLKDQRVRATAMAQAKGWPVPVEFADDGISGTKDATKRPGLHALLAAADAHAIDAVIVSELSRIGRKTSLVLATVEHLRQCGVALVSCKESLDTTTPTGQFVLTVFAALAQLERDQIADRTAGALAGLVREGRDKGGRIPFGYQRTATKRIVAMPRHAAIVRDIFEQRAQDRTMQEIADDLTSRGLCAPRGGTRWHATGVRWILLNEAAYRGGGSLGQAHLTWPAILGAQPTPQETAPA